MQFPHTPFYSLLLLVFSLAFQGVMAQGIPEDFTKRSDSLLADESASLLSFRKALESYGRDPLLLEDLISRSQKNRRWKGLFYGNSQLGILRLEEADYLGALDFFHTALATDTLGSDLGYRAEVLNLMGNTYLRIDSIKRALDAHQEVLFMETLTPVPSASVRAEIAMAYAGTGNIYSALGQWELGVDFYAKALANMDESVPSLELAGIYQKMGESLEALGRLDESLSFYEKSRKRNAVLGSDRIAIINAIGMAHVLIHQGRLSEARARMESLTPRIYAQDDPELLATYHNHFGWLLLQLKQYGPAEASLMKGLDLARRHQLTGQTYDASTWLHDLWEVKGDYQKALMFYKDAQSIRGRIANRRNQRYIYDAISRAEEGKMNTQLQMMAKDNELINLQLRRNRTTLLVGALLLVLFSMVLYVVYRQNQLNHQKKILALEQSRLRSQMNPHFLFNAINSIKHYIINNKPDSAIRYLNKFSKLIRSILEASTQKEVALQDELDTVQLYMNIENMRFNDQIDFKIEVSPEINPSMVKVPSLILQPFLENSLWHGLSSKEGPKKIRLGIDRGERGDLVITIRDNGIGRKASREIRERKTLKQESLGIPITRERLALFSRNYQNGYGLVIEDLYGEDGSADGTKVVLTIPAA